MIVHRWPACGQPRAQLFVFHGFGEHGLLPPYAEAGEFFASQGIEVWGTDFPGHGRDPRARGDVPSWDAMRERIAGLLAEAPGGPPRFLLGVSMGGLAVLDYALHAPGGLDGVVCIVPPLGRIGMRPWLQKMGLWLSRWAPWFALTLPPDVKRVTRDEALGREWMRDPLFHTRGTARLLALITAVSREVRGRAAEWRLPLLLMQGSEDRICPPDRAFFDAVSGDKRLLVYEGARHHLLMETNRDEVRRDILEWIEARAAQRSGQASASASRAADGQ